MQESTAPRMVKYVLRNAEGAVVQKGVCEAHLLDLQGSDRGLVAEAFDWGDDISTVVRDNSLEAIKQRALDRIDRHYAMLVEAAYGPFAMVHRLKLEQAQAGGGPLVADEDDRLAILEMAAKQAQTVAAMEPGRIALKRAVREAETAEQVEANLSGIVL